MAIKIIESGGVKIGGRNPFVLIAGPCVIESESMVLDTAGILKEITGNLNIPFIFKSSYLKDNRSSHLTFQGPGIELGLKILQQVKDTFKIPVLSDVHCYEEVIEAKEVLDIIQLPAYLSQQTRLALEIARTGKVVNIKKAQFIAPEDIRHTVDKILSQGNDKIILTERGTCFGYRNLVVDFRSIPKMKSLGFPVIFDVTHSIRLYGTPSSNPAGGESEYIEPLARAGVAVGIDGIFIETHLDIEKALCDRASMLPIRRLEPLLRSLKSIDEIVKRLQP